MRHRHLRRTLLDESAMFLLHVRSALVAILMLPAGVLMAFAGMKALGLGSNIMSLGGIAIAIGTMVDAAIVIENAHKHLERAQRIAVPMIGGMISSTALTLVLIPAIYAVTKGFAIREHHVVPRQSAIREAIQSCTI
jgi:Cu/Ag efflux pump CusA